MKNYVNYLLCSSIKFRLWKIFAKSLERSQFWIKVAFFKISNPDSVGDEKLLLKNLKNFFEMIFLRFEKNRALDIFIILIFLRLKTILRCQEKNISLKNKKTAEVFDVIWPKYCGTGRSDAAASKISNVKFDKTKTGLRANE